MGVSYPKIGLNTNIEQSLSAFTPIALGLPDYGFLALLNLVNTCGTLDGNEGVGCLKGILTLITK